MISRYTSFLWCSKPLIQSKIFTLWICHTSFSTHTYDEIGKKDYWRNISNSMCHEFISWKNTIVRVWHCHFSLKTKWISLFSGGSNNIRIISLYTQSSWISCAGNYSIHVALYPILHICQKYSTECFSRSPSTFIFVMRP